MIWNRSSVAAGPIIRRSSSSGIVDITSNIRLKPPGRLARPGTIFVAAPKASVNSGVASLPKMSPMLGYEPSARL